jgi:hypothetical protein
VHIVVPENDMDELFRGDDASRPAPESSTKD